MPRFLFVPGWAGSGPDHWQSRWQARLPGARRVEMPDWLAPERAAWIDALDRAIDGGEPTILVAHSLGCITVAHWAARHRRAVIAALLVAPADVERAACPDPLRGFAPIPLGPLPFPSTLVTGDDDPYVAVARAGAFADAWGSRLEIIEGGRHLNVASGHGDWPRGLALLRDLVIRHDALRALA